MIVGYTSHRVPFSNVYCLEHNSEKLNLLQSNEERGIWRMHLQCVFCNLTWLSRTKLPGSRDKKIMTARDFFIFIPRVTWGLLFPCILARDHIFDHWRPCRLRWRVTAVMLADTLERYQEQEKSLISDFKGLCHEDCHHLVGTDGLVHWVDRFSPRRYCLWHAWYLF